MNRCPAPTTEHITVTTPNGTALSRLAAEADADLDRPVTAALERHDALKVVLAVHREVYGTTPRKIADKHLTRFDAVEARCFKDGIDFALYVEAQINSYRFTGGEVFPLSWITNSDAASRRYEQYLKASFKKFRHQGRNTLSVSYTVTKIRRDIYADEFEAGRALCLIGDPAKTLRDVHHGTDSWQACTEGKASTIPALGGPANADRLYRACRLAAARDVANFYSPGLADYIFVVGEFAWAHLVEYLSMAFPPKPKPKIPEAYLKTGRWSAARSA